MTCVYSLFAKYFSLRFPLNIRENPRVGGSGIGHALQKPPIPIRSAEIYTTKEGKIKYFFILKCIISMESMADLRYCKGEIDLIPSPYLSDFGFLLPVAQNIA